MDRPKQAFCRCPKPLRPIKVQHPFAPPPLTRPLTLPPSTRNNQSTCLQTKQRLIAMPTAPYLTSRVNRSRQVPPSLRLPKEGSLAALLIGDSNLRHVDRRRLDQNGKIHVRTVGGATAGDFSASLTNQSPREDTSHVIVHIGTNDCSDTMTSSWSLSASGR